ncbi:ATP-binding protein [Planctomycetaceae bacterium SH139]
MRSASLLLALLTCGSIAWLTLPAPRLRAADDSNPAVTAQTHSIGKAIPSALPNYELIGKPTIEEAIAVALELEETWSMRVEAAKLVRDAGTRQASPHHKAMGALLLAHCYQGMEQARMYDEFIAEAEAWKESVSDPLFLSLYHRVRGVEQMREQEFLQAAQTLLRGLEYARLGQLQEMEAAIRLRLGVCLRRLGALAQSVDHYKQVYNSAMALGNQRLAYSAANNFAYLLLELGRIEEAEAAYQLIPLGHSDAVDLAVRAGFADIAVRRNQPTEALRVLGELRQNHDHENAYPYQFAIIRIIEARACLLLQDWAGAETACKRALSTLNFQPQRVDDAMLVWGEIQYGLGRKEFGMRLIQGIAESASDQTIRQKAWDKLAQLSIKEKAYLQGITFLRISQELRNRQLSQSAEVEIALTQSTLERQVELERLRAESTKLAADKMLAISKAERAAVEAIASRQIRNLTVGGSLLLCCGIFLYCAVSRRLSHERRLKEQESHHNQQLSSIVEEKTRALKKELSERADLERTLEPRRRAEALGKLTGCVAHDFNNLLQVVMTTNELLHTQGLTPRQIEMVDASSKSAAAGAAIIRQLLAYARQQTLTPKVTHLSSYFASISGLLDAAMGRQYQLSIYDESNDAAVIVDAAQLTTTLINLLSNAVDAKPRDECVKIVSQQVELDDEAAQAWSELLPGKYVSLEIIDRGKGLTAEAKVRAFEPFFSEKPPGQGTGLGLSSAFGFVRQSGGDIQISDLPDGGTRVTLLFPLTTETAAASPPRDKTDFPKEGHILVVEDDSTVGKTLESQLQHLGYQVELVHSGDAAIARLSQAHPFNLVLTDIRMSGACDGLALRDWVRSHQQSLSVVLMSGYADAGALDPHTSFLPKPFSEHDLLQTISAAT